MNREEAKESDGVFRVVGVIGLGLMGGSLCRALKALEDPPEVIGLDVSTTAGTRALESGAIDRYEVEALGIDEADLIVFAAPLGETVSMISARSDRWSQRTTFTDMVSLQAPVLSAARKAGLADRFVPAHPICGGERSGFDAGSPDLFHDATVWLSAEDDVSKSLRSRTEAFWKSVGGRPRWVEPEQHDERMAWVSHLPQLVANALAGALDAAGCGREELGPGGRDMTRLAGSNPEIWRDLLAASAPVTGTGLTSVSNALNVLADLLARREIDRIAEFMERTRRWSQSE